MNSLDELRRITESLPQILGRDMPFGSKINLQTGNWLISHEIDQSLCGVCHTKFVKGDLQPAFHTKQKSLLLVINGKLEIDTIHDGVETHHSLGVGEITEIPEKSNYEQVLFKSDVEFLFITVPQREIKIKVK